MVGHKQRVEPAAGHTDGLILIIVAFFQILPRYNYYIKLAMFYQFFKLFWSERLV